MDSHISTNVIKQCILAEEIGHYQTSYRVIIDTENISSIKLENRARRWAYNELLPLEKFVDCYEARCQSRYEVAELLDVTEDFLDDAIKSYQEIYGIMLRLGVI